LPPQIVSSFAEGVESKDLHSFRHFKFPPLENALKQACSKRVCLFDAIVASKTDTQSLEEAAHVLEAKRVCLGQTMTHAVRAMKAADSKTCASFNKKLARQLHVESARNYALEFLLRLLSKALRRCSRSVVLKFVA
jgi:hypothetical protein